MYAKRVNPYRMSCLNVIQRRSFDETACRPPAGRVFICGRSPGQPPKREVTVAAAANLAEVFQVLGPRFEAATGVIPYSALPRQRS